MADVVATVAVDRERARVYEHGWQSWSPTTAYRLDQRPFRPVSDARRVGNYRPERTAPDDAFWGEGLLAVDPGTGDGRARLRGAVGRRARSRRSGRRSPATASWSVPTGRSRSLVLDAGTDLETALARWADGFAAAEGVGPLRPPPTAWCSWYHYFERVTQDDIEENLRAIDDLALDIDVVQIDDGYQAEIGDWLLLSDRFASLEAIVDRIRGAGRRAGIWVAPFLVGERSVLAREHPDWLVQGATRARAGRTSNSRPSTSPGPAPRPTSARSSAPSGTWASTTSRSTSSMPGPWTDAGREREVSGVEAYRHGLRVIREAIGPDAYLLGCGAPILPSVGLVDAMRVGPDIAHHYEPLDGDLSQPSQRAAAQNTRWRAWQHGRFWVNDADCLVAGPHVERREEWAPVVEQYSGLRASSDRLRELDEWGLETTRRLLRRGLTTPFVP